MNKNFVLKKCKKCGAFVEVLEDCTCENCGIKCCGQEMEIIRENSVDASVEKHKPEYKVIGNYIVVSVNHVMEPEHFIDFVAISSDKLCAKKFFEVREGDWKCSHCNNLNFSFRNKCNRCLAIKNPKSLEEINKKASAGVNTPRHIAMKRVVE